MSLNSKVNQDNISHTQSNAIIPFTIPNMNSQNCSSGNLMSQQYIHPVYPTHPTLMMMSPNPEQEIQNYMQNDTQNDMQNDTQNDKLTSRYRGYGGYGLYGGYGGYGLYGGYGGYGGYGLYGGYGRHGCYPYGNCRWF